MSTEVNRILESIDSRSESAVDQLLPLIYDELRRLAASKLKGDEAGKTLQATALVHEVYLRLAQQSQSEWKNRGQFFAIAAETMRRILVDRSRRRLAQKRGGGALVDEIYDIIAPAAADDRLAIRVHEALEELASEDPQRADIVKLKFFVGLTSEEIASLLDVNEKTVRRHWSYAKAWLFENMS